MQLNCPSCAAAILADDMDLPSATAKCRSCQSLFSFREQMPSPPAALAREQVGLPERFSVDSAGGGLHIAFSKDRGSSSFMIVFLVFWFGFLIMWNVITISLGIYFMSAFSLIHVFAGLFFAHRTAATIFNTTDLRVDRTRLSVKSGPVPVGGALELPSSSVDQLFCTRKEHSNKGRRWNTYNVVAKTRDGREQTVLAGLETDRQALFIEQQIEKYLGIQDKAMPGELAK